MAKSANNFFKMEMILLKVLDEQDCYGYQITQLIKEKSNGNITLAEGTMYPILYRLLDNGYITDEKKLVGKRLTRIYYHLEPKGRVYLNELYEEYLKVKNSIDFIMEGNQ
jgi:PadR family transcriptional regulator PadR